MKKPIDINMSQLIKILQLMRTGDRIVVGNGSALVKQGDGGFKEEEDTRADEPVSVEERLPEKKSSLELARMIFPDKDDEFLNFVLWEKTGFPSFFNVEGAMTKEDVLLRQLIDFKATMPPAPKE